MVKLSDLSRESWLRAVGRTAKTSNSGALPPAEEIRAQLERILASSSFRFSKRHPRFLRYIVERTIAGEADQIKERTLGIAVFDRAPDYDVSTDSIVRVAAGEIRKRLAQYYQGEGREGEIVFELPPGSYVPLIHSPSTLQGLGYRIDSLIANDISTARQRLIMVVVLVLALAASGVIMLSKQWPTRVLGNFWEPILAPEKNSLVCIGDLSAGLGAENTQENAAPNIMRHRVGPYDLSALGRLTGVLGRNGAAARILMADDTNLADLRTQPGLLIGAFDNVWTSRVLAGARFQLKRDAATQAGSIVDTQQAQPTNWTVDLSKPGEQIRRDYALVARMTSELTGQLEVVVAGIGPYGTAGASEFVSNPKYFREFSAQAPRGWEHRNVEIVLSVDVVDGRSAPPHMVAFDVR